MRFLGRRLGDRVLFWLEPDLSRTTGFRNAFLYGNPVRLPPSRTAGIREVYATVRVSGAVSTSAEVYALNCSNPACPRTAGLKQAYATVLVASLPEQIGALTH